MNFSTKAIHVGQEPDESTGAVIVPIYQTSTYHQEGVGNYKGFEYSRTGNPTRQALEECIASLEHGKFGLAFSSGLAAEHSVLSLLKPGDNVVATEDMYGGTYRLFEKVFRPLGITFTYIQGSLSDWEEAITPSTKLLWLETPTNPLLRISDIESISAIAKKNNILLCVDNTFASSYNQQPLMLGADFVVHSMTKYMSGHSDIVGGAVIVNDEKLSEQLHFYQNSIGAVLGPFDSWLALRGIKTLAVRMKQHGENALQVAQFLKNNSKIETVYYPGLEDHPNHELAKSQMRGFGGMISFKLKNADRNNVDVFFKELKIISLAESLGGVESLVCYPAAMTHGSIPKEQREKIGITDNLIRLSIGIEDIEDIIEDLQNAINKFPK